MINLYCDPHGKKIFSTSTVQQQQQEVNSNALKQMKNEFSSDVMGLKEPRLRINELEHEVQQLKSLQVEL